MALAPHGAGSASALPATALAQQGAGSGSRPSAAALAQQGFAAHQRGDIDAAARAYQAALAVEPEHPLALHYLGVVLHQRGRHADALPLLARSVEQVPQEPEFHNNLGLVLAALDRNDEAIAAYRDALDRKPDHATAWNNMGLAWQALNRLPEATAAFRRALSTAPEFAQAHWNLSLALLADKAYAEGWREYEWRLRLPELGGRAAPLALPRWRGEDLRGRTLLVSAEQGLGDALQFVRFVAPLAARGVRVIVQAPADACALLASAPGVAATIATGEALPAWENPLVAARDHASVPTAEIPLLSLPHRLGITDIGATNPHLRADATNAYLRADATNAYLRADATLAAATIDAMAGRSSRLRRIGIAWAGAPHHRNDQRRSMPLTALAPLFALPGIAWYSLQKGPAAVQIELVESAHSVVALDPRSDLARTAALIDALDAVVTVDTSIAHLAGALGKPVHVMLSFAPDWRWGIRGELTPWYATARLFRQPAIGDWQSVVSSVSEALMREA